RPFVGASSQDVAAAVLLIDPDPVPRSAAQPQFASLMMRMLAKNRDDRPSATEVLRELEAIRDAAADWRSSTALPSEPPRDVAVPNNLPSETTSLLGRDSELENIAAMLAREDVRVVTITGSAGVGKTRMAIRSEERRVGKEG